MKTIHLSVVVVGVLTLAQAQTAFASCGTFEVSKGDVKVQSADGKIADAPVGSKICSGQTVIAADLARAKIHMEDGNELNISPNSKIVIETYQFDVASNKKKVLLNVLKGKVRATTVRENMYNDKSKDGQANTFQVRTKSAVAGVRGTDFLTSFDPKTNKMDIVTFRGKVEVGLPGPSGTILNAVQVSVGQRTEVTSGSMPAPPKAMPSAELTKINVETRSTEVTAPGAAAPSDRDLKKRSDDGSKDSGGTSTSNSASPGRTAAQPAAGPADSSDRRPASPPMAECTMCKNDLPSAPSAAGSDVPTLPILPPAAPALPSTVTLNPFISTAVQNKNANANVSIRLHY